MTQRGEDEYPILPLESANISQGGSFIVTVHCLTVAIPSAMGTITQCYL